MSKILSNLSSQASLAVLHELRRRVAADPITKFGSLDSISFSFSRSKFRDKQRFFCASQNEDGSKADATVVARISPAIVDFKNCPVGMLGFFESIDDTNVATDLLKTAVDWLKSKGCKSIVGPIDGDTWNKYRFNVGPHDDPPFLLEPTNPAYYPNLFAAAGFEILDAYHSLCVDDIRSILPSMQAAFDHANDLGYRLRPLNINQFEEELKIVYSVSTCAFAENFLYDGISWEEFSKLYSDAKSLVRPELVWFAEDPNGQCVGFLFCLIDYFKSVASMKGKRNVMAKLKFMRNRKHADAVNFKSIAVLPKHRRSKIGGALMYQAYKESLKLGFNKANLCLIRDGNPSSRLDGGNSRLLRRYELYQFPGSQLKTSK